MSSFAMNRPIDHTEYRVIYFHIAKSLSLCDKQIYSPVVHVHSAAKQLCTAEIHNSGDDMEMVFHNYKWQRKILT